MPGVQNGQLFIVVASIVEHCPSVSWSFLMVVFDRSELVKPRCGHCGNLGVVTVERSCHFDRSCPVLEGSLVPVI